MLRWLSWDRGRPGRPMTMPRGSWLALLLVGDGGWRVPMGCQGLVRTQSRESDLDSSLAVQSWASHLTSLSLSFPFGKWGS